MKRLTAIDAARGIASILVMLYHCNSVVQSPLYFDDPPFGGFLGAGSVRMPFFFAMSGFMLTWVHGRDMGKPERLRRYLLGRFARIYPAYWVVLGLAMLASAVGWGPAMQDPFSLGRVVSSFLLLPYPGPGFLVVAWMLQSLMIFYAVAALGIWRWRLGLVVFLVWQGATLVALMMGSQPAFPWNALLYTLFLDLLLGALAAQGVMRGWVKRPGWWLAAGAGYLGVALGLEFAWRPLFPGDWPLFANGLAASVMLMGLAGWELSHSMKVPRALLACGTASYAIFLVHYPLLSILSKLGRSIGMGQWFSGEVILVLFSGICIGAGILFQRWIEGPLTAWVQARIGLARGSNTAAPGATTLAMEGTRE